MRRWDEDLSADLKARNVQLLAVCTDTPGQIAQGRPKHGLWGTFLADRDLKITDAFGLRNMNLAARPPGLAGLPIPTTLLVNAAGEVVWKDQSPDYMQRSDPGYVRSGLALL
ncbi:MAG: redoxin domain-containing protein [Halioglobus sp.]|nr:redoxin domain-containing protein [Halioglobus sp.]